MKKLLYLVICFIISCSTAATIKSDAQSDANYQMGLSYMKEGKYQEAFIEMQKAIKENPDNKLALNALGLIYLKFEDFEKAEMSFLDAIDVDDSFSDAYNNLGVVYSRQKKWDKAIEQFENALKNPLYVSPAQAYYNIGNSYYRLRKYKKAIDNFRKALLRAPQFTSAYYGLALSNNMIELYGEAAAALMEGIKVDPEIEGNRRKAADVFTARIVMTMDEEERKDLEDLREILNY